MDNVHNLGVIYINHITESEADLALNKKAEARGTMYYHIIMIREPGAKAIYTPARIFIAIINEKKPKNHSLIFLLTEGGLFL